MSDTANALPPCWLDTFRTRHGRRKSLAGAGSRGARASPHRSGAGSVCQPARGTVRHAGSWRQTPAGPGVSWTWTAISGGRSRMGRTPRWRGSRGRRGSTSLMIGFPGAGGSIVGCPDLFWRLAGARRVVSWCRGMVVWRQSFRAAWRHRRGGVSLPKWRNSVVSYGGRGRRAGDAAEVFAVRGAPEYARAVDAVASKVAGRFVE
jgi:hypothetical protein